MEIINSVLPQLKLGVAALSEGSPRRAASMGNGRTENRQDERVGSKYCSWGQPSLGLHQLAPLVSNTAARAALRGLLLGLCRPLESLWAGEGAPPDPGASLASGWLGFFHPAPHSQRAKSGDPEMLLGPQGQCRSSSSTASCTLWPFSPGPAPLPPPRSPLGRFWSHQHEDSPNIKQQSW